MTSFVASRIHVPTFHGHTQTKEKSAMEVGAIKAFPVVAIIM